MAAMGRACQAASVSTEAPYDGEFFAGLADESRRSAHGVIRHVHALLQPQSVLDVGCGLGAWLAEWRRQGVEDIVGVDGDYVARDALHIDPVEFISADLRSPLDLGRRFDLVQSVEVAEHLPPEHAATFVASLVRHGDAVVFSAAPPGQGGRNHVNEQWPSYWSALFARHEFLAYDIVRWPLWHDESIAWYYRQNLVLYASQLSDHAPRQVVDVLHPGALEGRLSGRDHVRGLVGAVRRRLRSRS